jgi:tRNA pseudouridine38-40 synthase
MTAVPDQTDALPRFVLLLEYDGGRFAGSQYQANAPTVQAALEDAIEKTTGERTRVAFAGRTDAGTHARGQVASFLSATRLEPGVLQRALNAWLPDDVAVREAAAAPPELDVRRHALRRHYRYVIDNGPVRPALDRDRAWYVAPRLEVEAMAEAASRITGMHDFAAFAGPMEDESASTMRDLSCFEVRRRGGTIELDAEANAFLPHQVRRMVGALVEVGKGRLSADDYVALLDGRPASAGPVAPARGLYLMGVVYATPLFETSLDSEARVC